MSQDKSLSEIASTYSHRIKLLTVRHSENVVNVHTTLCNSTRCEVSNGDFARGKHKITDFVVSEDITYDSGVIYVKFGLETLIETVYHHDGVVPDSKSAGKGKIKRGKGKCNRKVTHFAMSRLFPRFPVLCPDNVTG